MHLYSPKRPNAYQKILLAHSRDSSYFLTCDEMKQARARYIGIPAFATFLLILAAVSVAVATWSLVGFILLGVSGLTALAALVGIILFAISSTGAEHRLRRFLARCISTDQTSLRILREACQGDSDLFSKILDDKPTVNAYLASTARVVELIDNQPNDISPVERRRLDKAKRGISRAAADIVQSAREARTAAEAQAAYVASETAKAERLADEAARQVARTEAERQRSRWSAALEVYDRGSFDDTLEV